MRAVVAVLSVVASALVFAVAPPAVAVTAAWTVEATPVPSVDNAFVDSVSCVSTYSCVAVGSYVATGAVMRPFAEVGSTTLLTASYPVVPSGRARSSRLDDVSCVSATMCVAVGGYLIGGQQHSLVETWDGHHWRLQTDALPGDSLTSVTCATADFCVAVATRQSPAQVETWDGQSWSSAYSAPTDTFVQLTGVSCRSLTSCVVVGSEYDDASSSYEPAAVMWDGAAWTLQLAAATGDSAQLMGVSCVSSTCTAVGETGHATLVEVWDGVMWTIALSPTPQRSGLLQHVSCVSASDCTAMGVNQSAQYTSSTLVETWDGVAWHVRSGPSPDPWTDLESRPFFGLDCHAGPSCVLATTLDDKAYVTARTANSWELATAANGTGSADAQLQDVSCAGPVCAAVGSLYDSTGRPFVEWYDGTAWHPNVLPLNVPGEDADLQAVSCASATFCVAVGESGRADSTGLSEVWNGRQWRPVSLVAADGTSRYAESVSCPAVNLCFAAGNQTDASTGTSRPLLERFDGRRWRITAAPGGTGNSFLQHISCATTTTCAVSGIENGSQGQNPFLAVGLGATWAVTTLIDLSLDGLTCSSATRCFATGQADGLSTGLVEQYDGSGWTASQLDLGRGTSLGAVSCRSDTDCLLVGHESGGNHGFGTPVAASWDGVSWTETAALVAPGAGNYGLDGVSASDTTYVAAGVADVDVPQPLIERYG